MTPGEASQSPAARAVELGGALAFFGSLAYFLFRYTSDFGRPAYGIPLLPAVLWNTSLFAGFALHHSVFARPHVRSWIAHHAPPPLERSVYVWVASVLFAGVCVLWTEVPGVAWDVHGGPRTALVTVQLAGVVLTLISATALDIRELAGLTPGRRMEGPRASRQAFKTTGPYGWVRHPIYAGWFLMVWPATPMTMTRLVFAVVSCAYLLIAIPWEERTLLKTADEAYRTYMKQVRWRLIPGVY